MVYTAAYAAMILNTGQYIFILLLPHLLPPSLPCNITITSFWLKINGYGGDQIFREPGPVPGLQTKITTIRDPDNYKASNNNCLFCPLFKLVTILSSGCTSR